MADNLVDTITFRAVAPKTALPGLDAAHAKLKALGMAVDALNGKLNGLAQGTLVWKCPIPHPMFSATRSVFGALDDLDEIFFALAGNEMFHELCLKRGGKTIRRTNVEESRG